MGAVVLIGPGADIAFVMAMAHFTGTVTKIAGVARIVVTADVLFTASTVIAQPITDVLLAREVGYRLTEGWIWLSIALYLLIGAFWPPVVVMQMRLRDIAEACDRDGTPLPPACHRIFWTWFAFGFPAFGAILVLLWLMITKPAINLFR